MPKILHILTRPEDSLVREILEKQRAAGAQEVDSVDLNGDTPDYHDLVRRIFAADSIEVW
jgi:hypothetical protein